MHRDEPLSRRAQVVLGVLGVVGVTALVEVLVRVGLLDVAGFPRPSEVIRSAGTLLTQGSFWSQISYTLREWMLALLMASVVGTVVGGLMGAYTTAFRALELPVEVFRVLPSIAFGPILALLLGNRMLPLSLTVALVSVWPILLNTMYGVRATDATAVQTARTLGLSSGAIFARIKLPSALPFAFTGVRVAASIGLIVAVSCELLIGQGQGIGGFILVKSTTASDLDVVYAATLAAGVLGVCVNLVFAYLDAKVFGWKKGLAQ